MIIVAVILKLNHTNKQVIMMWKNINVPIVEKSSVAWLATLQKFKRYLIELMAKLKYFIMKYKLLNFERNF